jgi:hypothetical protein
MKKSEPMPSAEIYSPPVLSSKKKEEDLFDGLEPNIKPTVKIGF